MINVEGYKQLSLAVFDSAFKDIIKDDIIKEIDEELNSLYAIKDRTINIQSKITKIQDVLRNNIIARHFFEGRNFYPWIEFMQVNEDYLVEKYNRFMGRTK